MAKSIYFFQRSMIGSEDLVGVWLCMMTQGREKVMHGLRNFELYSGRDGDESCSENYDKNITQIL
jgi:hypothetical protein